MQFFIGVVPPNNISQRLRTEFRYGTEPHVTVKAQSGLDVERIEYLVAAMRSSLESFGSFDVELGAMGTFGDRVAYLSVQSPRIQVLHALLVELVNPTRDERQRYHELDPYTPHLTIGRGKKLDFDELTVRVERLVPIEPFTVRSIWLFRQNVTGEPYRRFVEIPIG